MKAPFNADEMLTRLASESVKQGDNVRTAVRELTLSALKSRELSLAQIRRVLKAVTEGINQGATKAALDTPRLLEDGLAGMDDAVLKAVQASRLALEQLTSQGRTLREAQLKKALDDLEKLEDDFLRTIKEAADSGSKQLRRLWAPVLKESAVSGTETAAQIEATLQRFGEQMQTAVRQQRRTALKAAQVLTDNFTTLASGILTGLTEGLQQGRQAGKTKEGGTTGSSGS